MDKCKSVRQYLLEHFSLNNPNHGKTTGEVEILVREHLLHCSTCRLFQSDLTKIGAGWKDLDKRGAAEIVVPSLTYFESLVANSTGAPRHEAKVKSRTPGLTEVLLFLAAGITLLSGIGMMLQAGLVIPVGALFGTVAMLLPLMILIETPESGIRRFRDHEG